MYKDERYINAGTNEVYRFGKKALEKAAAALIENAAGYYSIPTDGGNYWTIGTSNGKYGEYAKVNGVCFSVNKAGNMYAKAGTEKGEAFIKAVNSLIDKMHEMNGERTKANDDE